MDIKYYPSQEPFFSSVLNKGNKYVAKYNCFISLTNPDDAACLTLYIPRSTEGRTVEVNSSVLRETFCFIPKGSTIFSNMRNVPMKAFEAIKITYSTELGKD